ncbi:MAG TPA: hypothetical protein VMV94_13000 [Phycisphaerae bacterium]|nr:hypothetical protein [Phycisphaerae bacterium]
MLPAISSDLPAYLLPPKAGDDDRHTSSDDFGPAVRVDISAEGAIDAQSAQPGTGLYGPDGQFVDSAARRDLQNGTPSEEPQPQPAAEQESPEANGSDAPSQPQADVPTVLNNATQNTQHDRDLALANYDSIIPPAAREELAHLADRVQRKSSEQALSPSEYKKLAELLMRVGRHSDAMWARSEAEKLQQGEQPADAQSDMPSSMLATAGVAS